MPKVYGSLAEKQQAKIIRVLKVVTYGKHDQLAEAWDISRQAVDYRIKQGNVTLLDLWKARNVIDLDELDINYLIGERG